MQPEARIAAVKNFEHAQLAAKLRSAARLMHPVSSQRHYRAGAPRRAQSEPRRGRVPVIHEDVPRMPKVVMDYRDSQRHPLASLAGRCGPVMTEMKLFPQAGRGSPLQQLINRNPK
jgi:hypothetical protein